MVAPVAALLDHDPAGITLKDGYQTLITIAADPDISFWEKTVQPPGLDGGDPIDTTTMHNSTWRTLSPRALITLTECTLTVAYDPDAYNQIQDVLNTETTFTVTFPDGSTLAFFGFLRLFEPQSAEEGAQPEANITIQPTNYDPVNKVEAGPVLFDVEGT